MARLGRVLLADQPLHVVQRGNDRGAIFFRPADYALYRTLLGETAWHHGCAVHAYVLMTNHVHLLLTPRAGGSVSRLMQWLGTRYVRQVNTAHRRTGTLWEGRFRCAPIESEAHLLACHRYIELNPVRAGMVAAPGDYPWSSYRAHAEGAADPVISDHPLFVALGADAAERRASYRALFAQSPERGLGRRPAGGDERRLGLRRRALQGADRGRCPPARDAPAQGPSARGESRRRPIKSALTPFLPFYRTATTTARASTTAVTVFEESGGVVHLSVNTSRGPVQVMANVSMEGDTLVLSGVHLQGTGAGMLGRAGINERKDAAVEFAAQRGASRVTIEGGVRTSGRYIGQTPSPITLDVP